MAYRYGNRHQMAMFPQSIEEYVSRDNPVRAYDAFVDALNLHELGINLDPYKEGNPEYDPKAMLKLLVYGYSYGVKSSRKLERESHNNISFIWLLGGLKPDHKTISEFRHRNKKALKSVLHHCAKICIKLGLIDGNVLFVDGTKIRANAGRNRTHKRDYYQKLLADLESRIDKLLNECESVDRDEERQGSYVTMKEELANAEKLKSRIKELLDSKDDKLINQTDPDCAIMRSVQGSHASYNVQSVTDDKHGLIVHAEAVNDTSDVNQFARQIDQANEQLKEPCKTACADAGYADTSELEKIDGKNIKVVVPSQRQALHKEESPFSKSHFTYDKDQDCYLCPDGNHLSYQSTDKDTGKRRYRITNKATCLACKHYGQCTSAKNGRMIMRLSNEEIKLKLEAQYEKESSQEIYARRKTRAEHPFGHIKRNLKTDGFLLRGANGVQAETSLLATCFNIARMVTIIGVGSLIDKLTVLNNIHPAPV